ncbi:hypothetical protein DAPPUDRAFT_119017 [Daphnia pulex]|uniref:Uncharacterized protein n=1 Tax=Daphnia pulex TaxID=6669 RepID=E9HX80_DAPPU|nr:hypothetical protein DAPPUDRAFT_119017 [Daphnia pulex]|eukprot:EFX63650.1 hypothetical protein DAPPUDRAFT_119017 [Daphnia pulex]
MTNTTNGLDFDTKNDEDVAFLWDVWYKMDWPEQTQHRNLPYLLIPFKLVLRDLLDNNLPENITITYDSQSLENIRTVWLSWWLFVGLSTLEAQSARKSLLEKINEERLNCIVEGWRELHCKDINPQGGKLVQQGKLDKSRGDRNLLRIWESPRYKKSANGKGNPLTILIGNAQVAQLLHFVLRLNSTKITPSAWQRKILPLEENSPWLATFITPLYQELDTEYVASNIHLQFCVKWKENE